MSSVVKTVTIVREYNMNGEVVRESTTVVEIPPTSSIEYRVGMYL